MKRACAKDRKSKQNQHGFFDQACKGKKLLEVEDEANLRSLSRPLNLTMSSPDASASAPSSSSACVPLEVTANVSRPPNVLLVTEAAKKAHTKPDMRVDKVMMEG